MEQIALFTYTAPSMLPEPGRFIDTPLQQSDPCLNCTLPFCNEKAGGCAFRVTDAAKDERRREREIRRLELQEWSRKLNALKKPKPFVPDTSLAVKYDKRRKPDSPRRQWERDYRRRRAIAKVLEGVE